MASAWGDSWGTSWGDSWGATAAPAVQETGGVPWWWRQYYQQPHTGPRLDAYAEGDTVELVAELFPGDATGSVKAKGGRVSATAIVRIAGLAIPSCLAEACADRREMVTNLKSGFARAGGTAAAVSANVATLHVRPGRASSHVRISGDVLDLVTRVAA